MSASKSCFCLCPASPDGKTAQAAAATIAQIGLASHCGATSQGPDRAVSIAMQDPGVPDIGRAPCTCPPAPSTISESNTESRLIR